MPSRDASVPFGAPYTGLGISRTEYRTAASLIDRRCRFDLTTSPNVIRADLGAKTVAAGSSVRVLDPDSIDLSGNVTGRFTPGPAPF